MSSAGIPILGIRPAPLRCKIAKRHLTYQSKSTAGMRPGKAIGTSSSRRGVYAGLATSLALAGAVLLFAYLRPSSPQKLIAIAYVQQRTLDLRIPDAGYARIR